MLFMFTNTSKSIIFHLNSHLVANLLVFYVKGVELGAYVGLHLHTNFRKREWGGGVKSDESSLCVSVSIGGGGMVEGTTIKLKNLRERQKCRACALKKYL